MDQTDRHKQLLKELSRLKLHFLPNKWESTGNYSDRKLDRTRAYKVLVHAEIEFYIENLLLDVVEKKYEEWQTSKKPSYVILCLLAASKMGWKDIESDDEVVKIVPPKIKKDDESINEIINRSVNQYREIVKNNNGLKSGDLKRLLMPVGIALSDLEPTWLNDMDSFCGTRGFFAHTSRLGIRNQPDPKTEWKTVKNLIKGLKELDRLISQMR